MRHRFLLLTLCFSAIVVLAISDVHAQQVSKEAPPSGSISGQVTLRGKPVARVSVAAIAGNTINRRDSAARSVTDGQGYYRIGGLPAGEYQVWALTPGLIAEQEAFPGYNPFGATKSILLSPNEDVGNVDLKLANGAVITGRITTTDNKPVVEERVILELLDDKGNSRFGLPQRYDDNYRTDDRGIYRIFGLPPGRYKVSVGYDPDQGVRGSPYPRTYYSDQSNPSAPAVIELKEGGEVDRIDIKVGRSTDTFTASGRIVDSTTGRPIAGVSYRIAVVEKEQGRTPAFIGTPSDRRGEFRFEGLRPGRYTIVVTSESAAGGNFYGDPVQFEIVDQDVAGVEIKATSGLTLSGFVTADGFTPKELLTLLPNLRVYARLEVWKPGDASGGGNAAVASDGSFQVSGLRPGHVAIDVFPMGRPFIRPTVARMERQGIDLGQGFEMQESISGLVVTLNYGTGVVRGTITFAGGTPSAEARMYVAYKRDGSQDMMGTQPDARGNFIVRNLAPGTYEFQVQVALPPGASSRPRPREKQIVTVANGSESEVNFLVEFIPIQPKP